jgi:hypothetical protein
LSGAGEAGSCDNGKRRRWIALSPQPASAARVPASTCAAAPASAAPPAICTVGKAKRMPFSSKAFLRREKGAAADDELLAGLRHHLHARLDRVIAELLDALHLQGLDDVVADLGVGRA